MYVEGETAHGQSNTGKWVMQAFVVGYPSGYGGADTELWHVLKLWRRNQVEVTLIPTWRASERWRQRCDSIGARTVEIEGPHQIRDVPGLAGSTVVSFCNGDFLKNAATFRELGCKVAWVGCMNWLFDAEIAHYSQHGPFDAYVFQSQYQRDTLFPRLAAHGVKEAQCHLIRGAFDPSEFPFRPKVHMKEEPFVVGRLSRTDLHKWHPDTWMIYQAIPFRPIQARVMSWDDRLQSVVGPPPEWAQTLSGSDETPQEFLASLHCLLQMSGPATENWSRVGLEAMSSGVPIITDRRGGWLEMIDHGTTGFLAETPEEAASYAGRLARREQTRVDVFLQAYDRLTKVLADPETIMQGWRALFEQVQSS